MLWPKKEEIRIHPIGCWCSCWMLEASSNFDHCWHPIECCFFVFCFWVAQQMTCADCLHTNTFTVRRVRYPSSQSAIHSCIEKWLFTFHDATVIQAHAHIELMHPSLALIYNLLFDVKLSECVRQRFFCPSIYRSVKMLALYIAVARWTVASETKRKKKMGSCLLW